MKSTKPILSDGDPSTSLIIENDRGELTLMITQGEPENFLIFRTCCKWQLKAILEEAMNLESEDT